MYNTIMKKRNVRGAGQGQTHFLLPLLFLIAAAALLLGFLQFRWISSVSTAEGSRLKQSLRNSAAQVINVASDEVRVLQALLYLTEEEFANRDWSGKHSHVDPTSPRLHDCAPRPGLAAANGLGDRSRDTLRE